MSYQTRTATVASGAAVSGTIDVGDRVITGIFLSAALTSATIGFSACPTVDGTYQAVRDSDGNAISVASASAGAIGLSGAEADALAPWRFIKITTASNEGADRTITLAVK